MILLEKQNYLVHNQAGNLLMVSGSFDDAIRAFSNSLNLHKNPVSYYQRAKCYLYLYDIDKSIEDLKSALNIEFHPILERDLKSLKLLQKLPDPSLYKKHTSFFLHQCLSTIEGSTVPSRDRTYNFLSHHLKADCERVYEFPIFLHEDFLAYQIVLRFYIENYKDALQDLLILEKLLVLHKSSYTGDDPNVDPKFIFEIYEFRFSPMTLNECLYNRVILLILLREYLAALETIDLMQKTVTSEESQWLKLLKYLLSLELKDEIRAGEAQKDINQELWDRIETKEIRVTGFEAEKKFANLFPYVQMSLSGVQLELRLAFNYPMIRPINMLPASGDFLLDELSPLSVPCSPEPPWIKRTSFGIKFTDDIQNNDIEFPSSTNEKEDSQATFEGV